jgi:hypothetical protein
LNNFESLNTTLLIATLRALTHEIDRAYKSLDGDDLDEETNEELALYIQDLRMTRTIMSNEYEARRAAEPDEDLTAVEALLEYFSSEEFLPK